MNRKMLGMVGLFAAMPLFFAGLNMFDGNRAIQSMVAIGYVVVVLALARWTNRSTA